MAPVRNTTTHSAEFTCGGRKENSTIAPKTMGGYGIIQVYDTRSLSLLQHAMENSLPVDVTIITTITGVGTNRAATRDTQKECFTTNVVDCKPHGLVVFG